MHVAWTWSIAKRHGQGERGESGFTLLELVAVIVLMGIIAAAAVGSGIVGGSVETMTVQGATRQLESQLRFVQRRALFTGQVHGLLVQDVPDQGPTLTFYRPDQGGDTTLALPGYGPQDVPLNPHSSGGGAGRTAITVTPFEVRFTGEGVPTDRNDSDLTNELQITVSGSGTSQTITITPQTGFIP